MLLGSIALNEVLWGAIATALFSGTSMATPVTAGNLALIYDAWHERTGEWPTAEEARNLLMASAHDQAYDVFVQGAGLVNADNQPAGAGPGESPSARIRAGSGRFVSIGFGRSTMDSGNWSEITPGTPASFRRPGGVAVPSATVAPSGSMNGRANHFVA
jgi:hypothetical protein